MIGMCLGMRCTLRQTLELTCSVCGQAMGEEKARKLEPAMITFGHAAYAICCCCRQEVLDRKDRNYRCRWRRWAKKLAKATPKT